jgi:hypothetical protein
MATYLVYANLAAKPHLKNASGVNALLISAADDSAALTAAVAASAGETRVTSEWSVMDLSDASALGAFGPVLIEGQVIMPRGTGSRYYGRGH